MAKIVDLNNFANGAMAERFNAELQKVLKNIADPNTDPKKKRKLTVTVTLEGNEERNLAGTSIQINSTLAPAKSIGTNIIMDYDSKGKITGAELKSGIKGQSYITEDGEVADDQGKIISFK